MKKNANRFHINYIIYYNTEKTAIMDYYKEKTLSKYQLGVCDDECRCLSSLENYPKMNPKKFIDIDKHFIIIIKKLSPIFFFKFYDETIQELNKHYDKNLSTLFDDVVSTNAFEALLESVILYVHIVWCNYDCDHIDFNHIFHIYWNLYGPEFTSYTFEKISKKFLYL